MLSKYILYEAKDYPETVVRMTEVNAETEFLIPAAATKETILALAEQNDLIQRIETYVENQPLTTRFGNNKTTHELTSVSFSVNGKKVETIVPAASSAKTQFLIYDVSGRLTGYSWLTPQTTGNLTQLNLPHACYFITFKTKKEQYSRKLIVTPSYSYIIQ
jgi:hypothetical protein